MRGKPSTRLRMKGTLHWAWPGGRTDIPGGETFHEPEKGSRPCHTDHSGQVCGRGTLQQTEDRTALKMSSQPERPKPVSVPKAGEVDVLGGSRAGAGQGDMGSLWQAEPGPSEQGGGPEPQGSTGEGMADLALKVHGANCWLPRNP